MAILNCDVCGSVDEAIFDGGESFDPHCQILSGLHFEISIDSQDNLTITAIDQVAWNKLNTVYWLKQLTSDITAQQAYMSCGCGDEVGYDANITQAQQPGQPFQQPTQTAPTFNMPNMGGPVYIAPPSGPLPSPPEVPKEEKKEEPAAHEPTTLHIELPDAVRKLIEDSE